MLKKMESCTFLQKLGNFWVSVLCWTGSILLGFFCWTLFWALFILFVGGGPIPKHCAHNSTHVPGLIACVQSAFAYGVLEMVAEGVAAIPGANYTQVIDDVNGIVNWTGRKILYPLAKFTYDVACIPYDIVVRRDYTTVFIIRDILYAEWDALCEFQASFTRHSVVWGPVCIVVVPEKEDAKN